MARLFDDAQSEYLEIDSAVVSLPFSVSCWFYTDTIAIYETLFFMGDKDDATEYYCLRASGAAADDPVTAISVGGGAAK